MKTGREESLAVASRAEHGVWQLRRDDGDEKRRRGAWSRRREASWQRRTAARIGRRNGCREEEDNAKKKTATSRRPTLQWRTVWWAEPGQRGQRGPPGVKRLAKAAVAAAAVAATKAGAWRMEEFPACGGHAFGCYRIGEARNPGPEASVIAREEQDDHWRQLDDYLDDVEGIRVGYDGIEAEATRGWECQEELVSTVARGADTAAVGMLREAAEAEGTRRRDGWWDNRLGEEVGILHELEEDEGGGIVRGQLLRDAFPDREQVSLHEYSTSVEEAFMDKHGYVADEPVLGEELEESPAARGIEFSGAGHEGAARTGVPLPPGLHQQLARADALEAERRSTKWRGLPSVVRVRRSDHAPQRLGDNTGGNARRLVLDRHLLPRVPNIEEVNGEEDAREADVNVSEAAAARAEIFRRDANVEKMEDRVPSKIYRRRARGRRQRGGQFGEIWLINSSGKPQLETALACAAKRDRHVCAILNQGHQQCAGEWQTCRPWPRATDGLQL